MLQRGQSLVQQTHLKLPDVLNSLLQKGCFVHFILVWDQLAQSNKPALTLLYQPTGLDKTVTAKCASGYLCPETNSPFIDFVTSPLLSCNMAQNTSAWPARFSARLVCFITMNRV